ncbi:MAG: hypothetical protein OEZ01_06865 [Candidatus Heimdallarchaeota archaeon]|nr:hypothetical protein [Candidatus Heimdallarchaeota archaeon]MDH5645711.1 hypothetical protein [Candidatus Heimdallarchaeota archaeon]
MLNIHFYGKLRKYAIDPSPTTNSIKEINYVENEVIEELLQRLNIQNDEVGEIFINHIIADLETIIPADQSRVALFEKGMRLIDGGQYIKMDRKIFSVAKQRFNQ